MRYLQTTKGYTPGQIHYQIYVKETLRPDGVIGKAFAFYQSTLDGFEIQAEQAGRRPRPQSFEAGMVTVREAAVALGVPLGKLEAMIRSDEITVDGTRSGTRYFLEEHLVEWEPI